MKLYHATNQYFTEFAETGDIGFHFGSKKAAGERLKAIGGMPEVKVRKVAARSLSEAEVDAQAFAAEMKDKYALNARMQRASEQGYLDRTFYHGTVKTGYAKSTDILKFDKAHIGGRWSMDQAGFFFISGQSQGSAYADPEESADGAGDAVVYPVKIKSKNPLVVDADFLKSENMQPIGEQVDVVEFWDVYQSWLLEVVEENGHDAVVLQDSFNVSEDGKPIEMVVVFDGAPVRSANSTFLPAFQKATTLHENDCPRMALGVLRYQAYETVFPRMEMAKFDRQGLKDIINGMSKGELEQLMADYSTRPIAQSYIKKINAKEAPAGFEITIEGERVAFSENKDEAKHLLANIKSSFMKQAFINVKNPLRMDDLGTWHPENIARELKLSSEQRDSFYQAGSVEDQYKWLQDHIRSQGYDSIVYQNAVEGKGSDSYIVFDGNHIEPIGFEQTTRNESTLAV